MRRTKWLTVSIALMLIVIVIAACSSDGGQNANSNGSSSTGTTNNENASQSGSGDSDSGERTKVTFWGDWGGEGALQFETMANAFNEAQDKYEVEYVVQEDMITKFMTASVSGQAPDVMFWDRWRTSLYAPRGVLHPIDDFIAADGVDRADFYDEALRELSYHDSLYGMPITVDARALFYNKTMFEEHGLEPPTTWEELKHAAKELTVWNGNNLERAGFSFGPWEYNMYHWQAGGDMITADGQTDFNNEAGRQVLELWDQFLNVDKVYRLGFEQGMGEGTDAFVTGRVAMLYTGPWMISTYQKYGNELDFGVVDMPEGPGGKASVMGGFGLVIPEASEEKEGAWEFIKWWTAEPENALLWGKTSFNIPGNKKAVEDPFFKEDPYLSPFLDILEYARIRPTHPGYSIMETDALIPNLELFLNGDQSIEDTLRKAEEQGNEILKNNQ